MRKSKMMKALLVFGMSVVTATAMVGFTACDSGNGGGGGTGGGEGGGEGGTPTCQHEYDGWLTSGLATNDANGSLDGEHWHECDLCLDKIDLGNHVDANSDGKCDVCEGEITHSFKEAWVNDNADGHWHEATCKHTTVKGSYSAHVDENEDGTCDTCGYEDPDIPQAYKDLLAKTTGDGHTAEKLYANSFLVGGSKLPEFSGWGNAGVYTYYTSTQTSKTSHYVQVTEGKATQVTAGKGKEDGAANIATVIDYGTVTIGTVEGYVEFSATAMGSSWNIVAFYNGGTLGDGDNVFALRIGGDKKTLYYTVNNTYTGDGTACGGYELAASTTYKLSYKFDLVTGKATIKIATLAAAEYTTLLDEVEVGINSLTGLRFVSGDGGNRKITVDNVAAIITPADLDGYKTGTETKAAALKKQVTDAGFTVKLADLDLSTAADTAACDTALAAYSANLLTEYKATVDDTIKNAYPAEDFDHEKNEDSAAYTAAITKLTSDIAAADTLAKVTKAYTTADGALKVLKDDDYWTKEDAVITVGNGISGANTLPVKVGDEVKKADLDALVTIPAGQEVLGYYDDEACSTGHEVTVPFNATASTTIYAKVGKKSGSESYNANNLTTGSSIAAGGVILDGNLFKAVNSATSDGGFNVYECTAATEDNSISFTKVLSAGGGNRKVTITAKADIKLTVYYTTTKSKYGDGQKANLQWVINDSTTTNTDPNAAAASRDKAVAYKCEITLSANDTCELSISDSKAFTLFGLEAVAQ